MFLLQLRSENVQRTCPLHPSPIMASTPHRRHRTTSRMALRHCFFPAVAIATARVQTQNNLQTKTHISSLDINCCK